jgi:hypothetical protein
MPSPLCATFMVGFKELTRALENVGLPTHVGKVTDATSPRPSIDESKSVRRASFGPRGEDGSTMR